MASSLIQNLRQKSYVIALSATIAFFVPVIASAETIRQPAGTPHTITAGSGNANLNMVFTAPVNGYIYSEGWYASANVGDWYEQAANTLICDWPSITNCVQPSNSILIGSESWYPFDFSANPKQIIKGAQYVALFEPRTTTTYSNGTVIGTVWGTDATSTVFFGTSGTTTAFCLRQAGLIDCDPSPIVQSTWFLTTTPLNVPITTLFPNATSTAVDLPTAQTFCGSETFATSTGFFDSTAQAFSRGLCLSFAYVFVPSSTALNQWTGLSDTLSNHIPFSYAYGIKDAFSGLVASTTSNLQGVTYTLPSIGSSSPIGTLYPTQIVGLSTSTIGTYLPESVRQSFLGLQRIALWLALALVIYRRIIPHHVLTKHT